MRTLCLLIVAALCACTDSENRTVTDSEKPYDPATFPPELIEQRDRFEATARQYVAITATRGDDDRYVSKFGGTPYWPGSKAYPVDQDGNPMWLLAQLNLERMPAMPDFPRSGMLQFFISSAESSDVIYGMNLTAYENPEQFLNPAYFRVVYHRNVFIDGELATNLPLPDKYAPVVGIMPMDFEYASEVIYPVDYEFEKIFGMDYGTYFKTIGDEATRHLNEYFSSTLGRPMAKVGGYGAFVQDDPRKMFPDKDWVILLWIDSFDVDQDHMVMWGDVGTAVFAIERSRLIDRDFSRVLYSWETH